MKKRKKRNPSQSKRISLLSMRPAKEEEERQLQLVTTSLFRLPNDWFVEEKRRPLGNNSNPGPIDKRYLAEGKIKTHAKKLEPGSECKGNPRSVNLRKQITPCTSTSSFILPDDWEIEKKPRRKGKYRGVIDKTYIEPGTGQRFRSLRTVERYLTEANESTPFKALMPANKPTPSIGSGHQKMKILDEILSQDIVSTSLKRKVSGENDRPSKLNFGIPPAKVNWVLAGRGESMWNPFVDDSKVPDSVKQSWSKMFISSIYGGNISAPSF